MSERAFKDMPDRVAHLPRDHRGFPVPKFVQWLPDKVTGELKPDFRIIKITYLMQCVRQNLCWICGGPLGKHKAFCIGPMCCVNRINSEPPSHYGCARFAALNCPFLAQPRMRRNEKDMPAGHQEMAGFTIKRNPGACCVWVTQTYKLFDAGDAGGNKGVLFDLGPPERLEFYASGREATREEVMESVRTGLPALMNMAERDPTPGAMQALERQVERFILMLNSVLPGAAGEQPLTTATLQ